MFNQRDRSKPAASTEWAGPRRTQPFLLLSVAAHLLLLSFLYGQARVTKQPMPTAQRQVQMTAALDQARRQQMRRQVRAMQDMQRKLAEQSGDAADAPDASNPNAALPDDPQALLQQAQKLADSMQRAEQKSRAADLSRLLKITPQAALDKVKADDLKRAAANAPSTAASAPRPSVAQLEQQAKATLQRAQERLAQQQARQEQGTPVQAEVQRDKSPVERADPSQDPANRTGGGQQAAAAQPQKSADRSGSPGGGSSNSQGGKGGNSGSGSGGQGSSTAQTGGQGGVVSAGGGFRDPRNYDGLALAVAVDANTLRPGAGRVLAAGGPLATRLYLNSWYIAGPFAAKSAGAGSSSLNEIYPPEHEMKQGVDLDAAYEGLGQRVLQWQPQTSASYPFVPQPRAENSVYYAYTELRVDTAQEVWLEIGADDDSKLWLNGELVWVSGQADKPWYRRPFYNLTDSIQTLNLVEGRRHVLLKPGRNTLMLKLYNGIDLMFFSVVVTP